MPREQKHLDPGVMEAVRSVWLRPVLQQVFLQQAGVGKSGRKVCDRRRCAPSHSNPNPDAHTREACVVTAASAVLETRALK